ncbi:DUF2911 domain-containing protein [Roseivirga pacifica]|uniref:DUF2911 domain-containing protein n=1 Tax=Roseivirga pacifica TaxID=1267423 RepID=UPI003BAE5769
MKNRLLLTLALLCAVTLTKAQDFPALDASPLDVAYFPDGLPLFELRKKPAAEPKIKLYYSRPQLKGRKMIGDKAAPFGKVWRLGANEAAEITFYEEVTFGSERVQPGTYALFAIPGEKSWTFILSNKTDTWGNYTTDENAFIARATTDNVSKPAEPIEALSIMFKGADNDAVMVVGWENTVVELPIKF